MSGGKYNQLSSDGKIVMDVNPPTFSTYEIREIIFDSLNKHDFRFEWKERKSQPYSGILNDGEKDIHLYIYAWNMTPAYRKNDSEKRIQIQAKVDNTGIDRTITENEKTIILGVYNVVNGAPLLASWDPYANRGHGQKSCYVQIEDVAQAMKNGICRFSDKNGSPIFTMKPEFLGQYVSCLKSYNELDAPKQKSVKASIETADVPKRKKRVLKSIEDLNAKIRSLSEVEQEAVIKRRIGQGYFRDLLMTKYKSKCVLCNISTESMLVASHIKGWKESNSDEKLDIDNGLLLCKHHDALFDQHLISFAEKGELIVSPTLSSDELTELGISQIPSIQTSTKMEQYLQFHQSKLRRAD